MIHPCERGGSTPERPGSHGIFTLPDCCRPGGVIERERAVRYTPRLENLVRGLIGVMDGEIPQCILLGESSFEVLESIRVEGFVRVVGFVWRVVRRRPNRRWGWRLGGSLHWERILVR